MKLSDDIDLQTGEYVLGTLEQSERRALEARAAAEPEIAAAIMVWERRLAPLHELVVPVKSPESGWQSVQSRIAGVKQDARSRSPQALQLIGEMSRLQGAPSAAELVYRIRRWRAVAIVAAMVAATLAGFVVAEALRPALIPPAQPPLLGVLHSETFAPPFVVALDRGEATLRIRSVPAVTPEDRSYAFWLVRPKTSPVLIGRSHGPGEIPAEAMSLMDSETLRTVRIGITVEPASVRPERPSSNFVYSGVFEID